MIVRLRVSIEDGLFSAGEILRVPGSLGHALIFDGKAENAPEAADRAEEYDPSYRRAARGIEDKDEAPPHNKMLPGPEPRAEKKPKGWARKWR